MNVWYGRMSECRRASDRLAGAGRARSQTGRAAAAMHAFIAVLTSVSAHAEHHSALDVAGPRAEAIERLWWLFTSITVVVYALVMIALLVAIFRARRNATPAMVHGDGGSDRRAGIVIVIASIVTVVTLIGLTAADFVTERRLTSRLEAPLRINVTAHQWWWELEYDDPLPANRFRVANELHIPTGRAVQLVLRSSDVIHSFWVPSLAGKKDLVPGHETNEILWAENEGRYEGQCAEFCGYQHAKMGFVVYAESLERFSAWQTAQRASARTPTSDAERHGQQVFLSSSCSLCHTIQGTQAHAGNGPDLTHIAARSTIAAAALPMNAGTLAAWISDPQRLKPGANMPATVLNPRDLGALVAYLMILE